MFFGILVILFLGRGLDLVLRGSFMWFWRLVWDLVVIFIKFRVYSVFGFFLVLKLCYGVESEGYFFILRSGGLRTLFIVW